MDTDLLDTLFLLRILCGLAAFVVLLAVTWLSEFWCIRPKQGARAAAHESRALPKA